MRYDLKDRGGVFTLADVVAESKKAGIIWDHHVEQLGLRDYVWNLPFVYVYERRDLTVSIYSVNIYPESIRRALEKKEFEDIITAKFTLKVGYDKQQNQRLELHIERKTGVEDSVALKERLQKIVVDQLNEENSEWRDFYADVGIRHKILPEITTWSYQDPEHFKPGAKQKWVKNKETGESSLMVRKPNTKNFKEDFNKFLQNYKPKSNSFLPQVYDNILFIY
jgi:hypothetical protein